MINKFIKNLSFIAACALAFASCAKDLDRKPFYDVTSASVYGEFSNYKQVLAKLYTGYAVTGQQGPAGRPDISGGDEGFSNYLRQYWQLQELTTDEALITWNDAGLYDLHNLNWTPANQFVKALYDRIYYQITLSNEFIREMTDEKLSSRGITGANLDEAKNYRAEARFLRALSYWHALDMFGNVPFVTEMDAVGSFFPEQIQKQQLFEYIESELKAIEIDLVDARQNEYARADKAAAWTLLAKLYLNAEVYTGQAKFTECLTYCNKVISSGFTLEPEYRRLFLTDNHNSNEIIFPIAFDGLRIKTYGGMTYLVHAPVGGNMSAASFGINGGWGGLRTTKAIVNLFPDPNGVSDKRAMFHTNGQQLEINSITEFTDGYPITKYKNISSTGVPGSDRSGDFPDTDFPMFRLADVYLMYAEAVLSGGTEGSTATALDYINDLRERAYGNMSGNIAAGALTLPFIIDERARELNWEAHRRTDLIRFERFTSDNYLWPWKGGVINGRAVEDYRRLFPIPTSDLTANPNLEQNPGY